MNFGENADLTHMSSPRSRRIIELDVLRGIAVIMVMGPHVPAYPVWAKVGGWGVLLFFVLSGFLISNLIFTEYVRHSSIDIMRFYVRRALKVYPSFYLLLAGTVIYCFLSNLPMTWQPFFGELILTQNYLGGMWGHTWSLAVEEHFYLLLPIALLLMVRTWPGAVNPFRLVPYVSLLLGVGCLGARLWMAYRYPVFDHRTHISFSHLCFDSLFFGVLLSYLHNFRPETLKLLTGRWRKPVFVAATIAIMPCLILDPVNPLVYTFGISLAYQSFGLLLILSLYKEKPIAPIGRAERAIAWIGTYSYNIYLVHVPLAMAFASIASRLDGAINQYLLHAIYCFSCFGTGFAISKLVEIPILRIRDRLLPSRSGSIQAAGLVAAPVETVS